MTRLVSVAGAALLVLSLHASGALAQSPMACDADGNGYIDQRDLALITAARNKPASGPTDPRDADRNGVIDVLDARACSLRCFFANCALAGNAPPVVSAGPGQTVPLAYGPHPSAWATLAGNASDDGNPKPSVLTIGWSKVSGPGAVWFADPAKGATQVALEKIGRYVLRLTASDGAATRTSDVTIDVVAPAATRPTLRPVADRTIVLGSTFRTTLAIDEPNGFDTIRYALVGAPAGAALQPAPVVQWTPTASQLGTHTFTVRADNATASDIKSFKVTVVPANRAPTLSALTDATAFVGATFVRALTATDADAGDVLQFALLSAPAGMTLSGNVLRWSPTAADVGEHAVTVRVADAAGAADIGRFMVEVTHAARPVARDDAYTVQVGRSLTVASPGVLANDVASDGSALGAQRASDPDKGSLATFDPNGGFTYVAPAALPPRPPLAATTKWHADVGLFSYAMAIGDLDGDGVPDVVHLAYNNKVRALRGTNGTLLWGFDGFPASYANCIPFLGDDNVPVIADIDDDGRPDIVLHVGCNTDSPAAGSFAHTRVMALDGRTGAVKWLSPRLIDYDPKTSGPPRAITEAVTLTVARLAPNESPSILGGHTIEDFTATNACAPLPGGAAADKRCRYVFALNGSDGTVRRTYYSKPADQVLPLMGYDRPGLSGIGRFETPIVLDFDGDGTLEVAYEGSLWSATGALLRQFAGTRAWPSASRAAAADLDGDGTIDLVLLDQQVGRARAVRVDGTILWDVPASHCRVALDTSCAVSIADVDGDHQPDVLIAGRDRLVVLNRFGQIRWAVVDENLSVEARLGCDNRPAVYDLDGDGVPEVVMRNAYAIVFRRGDTGAEITRMSTGPANSGYLCAVPQEVRVVDLDNDGQAEIVWNQSYDGISGLNYGGIWVARSANDPWMPARKLFHQWGYTTTSVDDNLHVPATAVRPSTNADTNLFGQQRQLATRPDLRERARTSFAYTAVANGVASDPATVAIEIAPPNRPPVITSTPPAAAPQSGLTYQLTATDPDIGDTLTWSLVHADFFGFETAAALSPNGLFTKGNSNPAAYLFVVRVTDSQGAYAEQAFTVNFSNQTATVPSLVGQTLAGAQGALATAALVTGPVALQYDGAPAGQVIGQAPGGAVVVPRGAAVALTVSKGPEPRTVPDVQGEVGATAATRLTGAGFTVGSITYLYSATVARGDVIAQTPSAGALIVPGKVDLVLSGGVGLELRLSHRFTTADQPIQFVARATAPDGTPTALPALTYSLAPVVTPFVGPLPTITSGALQFASTTRGAFRLTATDAANARATSSDFVVVAPRVGGASPLQEFVDLSGALEAIGLLLHDADAAARANDAATTRARVISAITLWRALDRDALRLAAPLTPETGFIPTLQDLAAAGVLPGPDDAITKSLLRKAIPLAKAWTQGLRADGTSLAQLNVLADAFTVNARRLDGLAPGEYGTVAAAPEYAMLAAHVLPDLFDALFDELAHTVGMAPQGKAFPHLKSSLAEQITTTAVQAVIDRIDTAKQFAQDIVIQAGWGAVMVAAAQHARAFLQGQELEAVVSGASLSFRVFEAPWSFIEGRGLERDYPELNTVILLGPDILFAVMDTVDKLKAASKYRLDPKDDKGRYKSAGEIKEDLKGFEQKLKALLSSGQGLVDAIANAFQSTDTAGQCVFTSDPSCVQLEYDDGFKSVYHYSPPGDFKNDFTDCRCRSW